MKELTMHRFIGTAKELRTSYEILRVYEKFQREAPSEYVAGIIRKIKKSIREYQNRDRDLEGIRVVHDCGIDGAVLLVELPEWIEDEDQAQDAFMESYYIHCRPSQYDCTGRAFTGWYKIFKRRGRWMAYHRVCMDV